MKQWQTPNNLTVILPDGNTATFLKMAGMYGKWLIGENIETFNVKEVEKVGMVFKVKEDK